ncbi:MAG: glycosyltransferase family 39 protein [Rhizobacter sp.]
MNSSPSQTVPRSAASPAGTAGLLPGAIERGASRASVALVSMLCAVILLRVASLAGLPLMDTTEARYAEIGRKMLELGDWITPWHDYGIPFWGKPPLSFWLTAGSMKLFGVNEFAARLPHFLCMVAVGWECWCMAASRRKVSALVTIGLLAGAALSLLSAGAVMTDAALVLGTTLSMRGFWLALHGQHENVSRNQCSFFVGISIGLLAKGPLALVLVGLPLMAWVIWSGQWRKARQGLPWVKGLLVSTLAVSVWYVAAELKTPGFLAYFIVGEHWHRFVTPGWSGDLYGYAHAYPPGTIWEFALLAICPWPLVLGIASLTNRHDRPAAAPVDAQDRDWLRYLVCWSLASLVFFTAARNIILPYALPAMPALALLGAAWLGTSMSAQRAYAWVAAGLAVTLASALAGGAYALTTGTVNNDSAKAVVALWRSHGSTREPLVFVGRHMFSASFYSRGHALHEDTAEAAAKLLAPQGGYVVLDRREVVARMNALCVTHTDKVGTFQLLRIAAKQDEARLCQHETPRRP